MLETEPRPVLRPVRDKAFAKRLDEACDSHPHVPPYNFGRLAWVREHLQANFAERVSTESVRKWFAGEARPRPEKMKKLAVLLGVDEAWLSLGISPEMTPPERKAFNASATGAVNVVAGMIQLNGGHPAFPKENDSRLRNSNLAAIIQGVSHAFYVSLGQPSNENKPSGYRFAFPADYADTVILGVVRTSPLRCDFLRFSTEMLDQHAARRGGHAELSVVRNGTEYEASGARCEKLKSFSRPLI